MCIRVSHNILAVGCNDQDLLIALNSIISAKGGLSVASEGEVDILSLPIAGIMTDENGEKEMCIRDRNIYCPVVMLIFLIVNC